MKASYLLWKSDKCNVLHSHVPKGQWIQSRDRLPEASVGLHVLLKSKVRPRFETLICHLPARSHFAGMLLAQWVSELRSTESYPWVNIGFVSHSTPQRPWAWIRVVVGYYTWLLTGMSWNGNQKVHLEAWKWISINFRKEGNFMFKTFFPLVFF